MYALDCFPKPLKDMDHSDSLVKINEINAEDEHKQCLNAYLVLDDRNSNGLIYNIKALQNSHH